MTIVTVELPSSTAYHNLYTLSDIAEGTSLIVANNTNEHIFLVQAETLPAVDSTAYPCAPGQTYLVHYDDAPIWIKGPTSSPIIIQTLTSTITPFTSVELPHGLYTSQKEGFRRIRVDVAQTGFFEGREFRTFRRLNIPATESVVIKVVSPINVILFHLGVALKQGDLEISTIVGGTEGGSFNIALPVLPTNAMTSRPTPYYAPQVTASTGGTITGGTEIDLLLLKAASNSNFAISVGAGSQDERGVAAGTYYFKLTNVGAVDAVLGVLSARWEDRPAGY